MAQVFLIMRRTDIPDGVLQVLDLWPNTSSKNYIYPPGLGQTGYIKNISAPLADGSVGAGPTFTVSQDIEGCQPQRRPEPRLRPPHRAQCRPVRWRRG